MKSFNKFVDLKYFINFYDSVIKFGDITNEQLTRHIDSYYLSPSLFEALSNHDIAKIKEEDFMTLVTMAHNCDNIICKKFDPDINNNNVIKLDDMINYGSILLNNDIISNDYVEDIASKIALDIGYKNSEYNDRYDNKQTILDTIWYIIKDMKHVYYNAYENNVHNMIDLKTMATIYNATADIIKMGSNDYRSVTGDIKHTYKLQKSLFSK